MHALPFSTRQALPCCRRIRQPTEFKWALRESCLANKWFAVYVRKNESGYSRLGVIAGKRSMPKAVARNFAKRMIRNVFRLNFAVGCSVDVVVRAKRQLDLESSAEGRQALLQLLQSVQV